MTAEAASLVRRVREVVVSRLAEVIDRDFDVPAGSLQRTCMETLIHMAELPHGWASRVATRSHVNDYVAPLAVGDDSPVELLGTLDAGLAVFADVLGMMKSGEVAAHSAGLADSIAWVSMIADEELSISGTSARGSQRTGRCPPTSAMRYSFDCFRGPAPPARPRSGCCG